MPEVSRFFGIVVSMFYNDHPPAHFHARYGGHKALVAIESLTLLRGSLPPRVLGLVVEWATKHRAELWENWNLAREEGSLNKITPLE